MGGTLLKEWNLPERLVESVFFHHSPSDAPHYSEQAAIINLADGIILSMELGKSGEVVIPSLESEEWENVGLSRDEDDSEIKDYVNVKFEDVVNAFLQ